MLSLARRGRDLPAAATLLFLASSSPALALSLFQVGNSFTFDSKPAATEVMLERVLGEEVDLGYHVRGNQTLNSLWTNPSGGGTFTVAEYGAHPEAFANHSWDVITLQSFPSIDEPKPTLGQELARIQDFVDAADAGPSTNPEILVYGAWAGRGESAWTKWHDTFPDDLEELIVDSASYHELLYDKVEALYPGRVRLVSTGKVIREVRDQLLAGEAPELEIFSHLYLDNVHMSRPLGRFIASSAMQTAILGRSMVGQPVPDGVEGWNYKRISASYARWAQLTAWEVLLADPRSGIAASIAGDYDGNGSVNYSDLSVFLSDYGSSDRLLADGDNNGVIDDGDLVVWQDAVAQAGGLNSVAGDFDGNGVIDRGDLGLLQFEYGATNRSYVDANNDGFVDAADYTIWRDAFEAANVSVAIPEPAGLAVALLATGLLAVRRRAA